MVYVLVILAIACLVYSHALYRKGCRDEQAVSITLEKIVVLVTFLTSAAALYSVGELLFPESEWFPLSSFLTVPFVILTVPLLILFAFPEPIPRKNQKNLLSEK